MDKAYEARQYETEIYKRWEESGFFAPDLKSKKEPFCVIMPPPNSNGSLHIGHAVFVTLEDIMIRYHRMKGKPTLWLPGADHAGFETQVVYQKKLEKEGRNWFTIPRGELYEEIWDFTQKNKTVMEGQLRRLGASCDWSREIFTLDEGIIKIVYQTFKKLHNDGLLYRGERIVNWCVKHQTTLSDLEVKHEEKDGALTHIRYNLKSKIKNLKSDYIVVATTRPETMLGDTAVAVNPKDRRYKDLVGQTVILPLVGREIPIVADAAVDMEFGTGAVKVTPAHDPLDFEIAERHHLEKIQVIGQDGKMTDRAPEKYRGLKAEEARSRVVGDLRALGLINKEEPHKHAVGVCYKCNRVIEPLVLPQWFIKMKPLAEMAMKTVKNGEVKFVTKRFEKVLFHWLKNIRDWNISRQIVWGIRIPAWYCENPECPPIITAGETPQQCPSCRGSELKQETDVFDTWFSSGQWPFAALQAAGDFKKFYPTSVMETGWDILPFWVMRMIMLGKYITCKAPFKHVYLHGLVRDKDRQKMSKSKGNAIDPLGVVDMYGADALRMALVFGVSAGNDIVISEDKIRAHRNFANKIWNASRFVLMNLGDDFASVDLKKAVLNKTDKAILKKLAEVTKKVTKFLDKFEFHLAAEEIYQFFWHEFCDKYLEEVKPRLQVEGGEKQTAQAVLRETLVSSLKLLHPFMPFVTEAVYQMLPKKEKDFLMIENWPK
ncbi:MAG: valine--tRNA ligase [Candidatus Magasanikbacteria bacterium]|nr:valine--tRNA ligase [Candidatus Magasanikbacteria bacterium]